MRSNVTYLVHLFFTIFKIRCLIPTLENEKYKQRSFNEKRKKCELEEFLFNNTRLLLLSISGKPTYILSFT